MLKNIVTTIAVAVIVVLALGFWPGAGPRDQAPATPVSRTVAQQEFMEGCYDGSNRAFCQCGFDYLWTNYSAAEIERLGMEHEATGELPDAIWEATKECFYELEF